MGKMFNPKKELEEKDNPFGEDKLTGNEETIEDIVGEFREDLKENEGDIETPPLEDGLLGVQIELEKKDKELREGLAKDGNDWNDVVLKEDRKD